VRLSLTGLLSPANVAAVNFQRGFFAGALLTVLGFAPSRVAAQDVIVTPLAWKETRDAPDELPAFKKPPLVKFPEELSITPDIGYVVKEILIDEKGGYHGGTEAGTQPAFLRAVMENSQNWKFNPGRREGKGVYTDTVVAFIFNPASAAENQRDATPRLLEVAVVNLPAPKGSKPTDDFPDQVVFADVSVDATGAITAVKNGPPALARRLAIAAKNWRFAPARGGGQPVASEVRVPFVIIMGGASARQTGKLVQPIVKFQTRPVYPWAMQANGMRGEVLVDFVVDIEGRVRNAFVVRSLNPSFDDPALEAVRKWLFEPGRAGDRPVNTHMQVPIFFQLDGPEGVGKGPLKETDKADLSKLPEQFRYDTPPRPTGTVRPVYPYALLRDGKTGRASVAYATGLTGRVEQVTVAEATAPEFGRALAAALEQFTHEPALKGGRPCAALQKFSQEFGRDESLALVDSDDLALLRRETKKPESIVALRDLDTAPVPRSRRPPVFPRSVPETVTKGEALVEFLIDEDGRARLPRIVSATDDAFGYAAVQSIASWRFEPPQRGGKSVVVRVQIPVNFSRTPAADAAK
jgi:TonB family protein